MVLFILSSRKQLLPLSHVVSSIPGGDGVVSETGTLLPPRGGRRVSAGTSGIASWPYLALSGWSAKMSLGGPLMLRCKE